MTNVVLRACVGTSKPFDIDKIEPNEWKLCFQSNVSDQSSQVYLKIENGVAVDPQSSHVGARVYCDPDGTVYSAVLSETDLERGINSYHKLQILVIDK